MRLACNALTLIFLFCEHESVCLGDEDITMEQTASDRLNEVGQPIVTEIPDVSQYTPTQIRESIQWLVAKDNVDRAQKVAEASREC